jgi:cytoskeletal protein RodZ
MAFLHKRLGQGDGLFGADLRDLRESRDIALEQAAEHTRIRITVLEALEQDRVEDLGDPAFAERHLMTYVRYLGGHEPYFLARHRERIRAMNAERKVEDLLPRTRRVRALDLFVGPQLLAIGGVILLAALLGGYVLWQAYLVRIPPPITITSPQEGEVLQRPTVLVQGETMAEAHVIVNGRTAPVDSDGFFSLSVDVRRGTTPITVVARRRRGSETQVTRNVVYDSALLNAPSFPVATSTTSTVSTTSTAPLEEAL